MSTIIVIGAGMGGLAAAIRLRVAGHEVDVLEANVYAGGKLGVVQLGGYRFDAGPSLFTQPGYHAELFALAGKRQEDYFTYQRLETACHYFWPDGTRLQAASDPAALARQLAETLGEDEQTVLEYLKQGHEKFALAGGIFLNHPLQKLSTYTNLATAKAVLNIGKLQMLKTLHAFNSQVFADARTVQLFDRYATYNGSDPYQASALYSMIPSFEHGEGAYFPTEGMVSIASSLQKLAEDIGVRFHFDTRVDEVLWKKRELKGIRVSEHLWPADAVVSNADITHLYKDLMPSQPAPDKALSLPLSTSAIVFYWGMRGSFPELGLHNVFFSNDYAQEFNDLFSKEIWPDDPTIYVNISSKHKPDDAPPGCENWFVMVNVPARPELATPQAIAQLKAKVVETLSQRLGKPIDALIEQEAVLTPGLLQQRTSSHEGALYGANSNSLLSGFWRHPNFSDTYPGLFFTGGTVHPGGGIPLALKSGQIAAGLANLYLKRGKT